MHLLSYVYTHIINVTEVETEKAKCDEMVNKTFDEIVDAVNARRKSVLDKLGEIAKQKMVNLEKKREEMTKNAAIATSVM